MRRLGVRVAFDCPVPVVLPLVALVLGLLGKVPGGVGFLLVGWAGGWLEVGGVGAAVLAPCAVAALVEVPLAPLAPFVGTAVRVLMTAVETPWAVDADPPQPAASTMTASAAPRQISGLCIVPVAYARPAPFDFFRAAFFPP